MIICWYATLQDFNRTNLEGDGGGAVASQWVCSSFIIIIIINLYLYTKSYHLHVFLGIVFKTRLKYSKELLTIMLKIQKLTLWIIRVTMGHIFPMDLDWVVQDWAQPGDFVLCSWARHLPLAGYMQNLHIPWRGCLEGREEGVLIPLPGKLFFSNPSSNHTIPACVAQIEILFPFFYCFFSWIPVPVHKIPFPSL